MGDLNEFFVQGTKFEIDKKADYKELLVREVKDSDVKGYDEKAKHQIIPIVDKIIADFGADPSSKNDFIDNFKKSSPPFLIEFSRKTGLLFLAFDKILLTFQGDNLFQLLTKYDSIKNKKLQDLTEQHKKFPNPICQLILVEDEIIVDASMSISVFKQNDLMKSLHELPTGKFSGANFIRQISHNSKTHGKGMMMLITTDNQNLYEYNGKGQFNECGLKVRSAIYNQTGSEVIALTNKDDTKNQGVPHVSIFKSGDLKQEVNTIKFDFPQEVQRNYFRTYYITPYQNGTAFIMGAIFLDESDIEDLIGSPVIFILNQDLNISTKWESMRNSENQFFYFYDTNLGLTHNSDADDGSQPIIRAAWQDSVQLSPPQEQADDENNEKLLCCLQMNHERESFILLKDRNGRFTNAQYEDLRKKPYINRPMDNNGDELMSVEDCLGTTLGIFFMDATISSTQKQNDGNKQVWLHGDEGDDGDTWKHQPLFGMFGLDGQIYLWEFFQTRLRNTKLPQIGSSNSSFQLVPPVVKKSVGKPSTELPKPIFSQNNQMPQFSQPQSQIPDKINLTTPKLGKQSLSFTSNFGTNKNIEEQKDGRDVDYGQEDQHPDDKFDGQEIDQNQIIEKPFVNSHSPIKEKDFQVHRLDDIKDKNQLDDFSKLNISNVNNQDYSQSQAQINVVQDNQILMDPQELKEIADKQQILQKKLDKFKKEELEMLSKMLVYLNMSQQDYERAPPDVQKSIDDQFEVFIKMEKRMEQNKQEQIHHIEMPQKREAKQREADEKVWRQQFRDSFINPQDNQQVDDNISDHLEESMSNDQKLILWLLKAEENLTYEYNKTVVRQMRGIVKGFFNDMSSLPVINTQEIQRMDHDLPSKVVDELKKVRNTKIAIKKIGQSKDIMKRELQKGLPTRESHAILNRSINACLNDHEFLILLIDKLKDLVAVDKKGQRIKLFNQSEIDKLKKTVNKSTSFKDELLLTSHKVERSFQIPMVIYQQLKSKPEKMSQLEYEEMMKFVDQWQLKTFQQPINSINSNANGIDFSKKTSLAQQFNQNIGAVELGQDLSQPHNIKEITKIARDFSNTNMLIQGQFITELFKSLQSHMKTLDTFVDTQNQNKNTGKQNQGKSPQKITGWGLSFDHDLDKDNLDSDLADPVPITTPYIQKKLFASHTLQPEYQEKRKQKRLAIRQKLKQGKRYRTATMTYEMTSCNLEEEIQAERLRILQEAQRFTKVLEENNFEKFIKERQQFQEEIKAQIIVNIPPGQPLIDQQQQQQLKAQPGIKPQQFDPPQQNIGQALFDLSAAQANQKNDEIHKLMLENEKKKIKELQKYRQKIEQEEKAIQESFKKVDALAMAKPPVGRQNAEQKDEEKKEEEQPNLGMLNFSNNPQQNQLKKEASSQKTNLKTQPKEVQDQEKKNKPPQNKPSNPMIPPKQSKKPDEAKKPQQLGDQKSEKPDANNKLGTVDDVENQTQAALKNWSSKGDIKEPAKDMNKFAGQLDNLLSQSNEADRDGDGSKQSGRNDAIKNTKVDAFQNKMPGMDKTFSQLQPQNNQKFENNAFSGSGSFKGLNFKNSSSGILSKFPAVNQQTEFGQASASQIAQRNNQQASGNQPKFGSAFGGNNSGTANGQTQQSLTFSGMSGAANPSFSNPQNQPQPNAAFGFQNVSSQPQQPSFFSGGGGTFQSSNPNNQFGQPPISAAAGGFADDQPDMFARGPNQSNNTGGAGQPAGFGAQGFQQSFMPTQTTQNFSSGQFTKARK